MSARLLTIVTCVAALAIATPTLAADSPANSAGDTSAALYRQWYELRKSDPMAALPVARRYLEAHPTADNADFLRKWVADTRARAYADARQRHDIDAMIALAGDAGGEGAYRALDFILFTAFEIRERELFHSPPVGTHAAAAIELARKAIGEIESGAVPPSAGKSKWNREATLAMLEQTVALAEQQRDDKAAAARALQRAIELQPTDPANHLFLSRLHEDDFRRAFDRWRYLEGGGSSAAATEAARVEAERWADSLLQEWEAFLAHSENRADLQEHRAQVLNNLQQVYRFRHPGAEDKLKKLVASYQ